MELVLHRILASLQISAATAAVLFCSILILMKNILIDDEIHLDPDKVDQEQ